MWASHPQTQYPSPGPKPDEETERNAEPEWNPGLFSIFFFSDLLFPRAVRFSPNCEHWLFMESF